MVLVVPPGVPERSVGTRCLLAVRIFLSECSDVFPLFCNHSTKSMCPLSAAEVPDGSQRMHEERKCFIIIMIVIIIISRIEPCINKRFAATSQKRKEEKGNITRM